MVVRLGDPIALPGAFSSNRATYLARPGFLDTSESVYSSANMRKLHVIARDHIRLPHRSSVRLLKPVELVRYKQLVFGHGFRSAEGPVGRNGALPGPSCAQESSFSCLRLAGGLASGSRHRLITLLGVSICVTRAGRFTYERRVEYHQPLVNQPARLSPCVRESASRARLAQKVAIRRGHGANAATSGRYGCSSLNRCAMNQVCSPERAWMPRRFILLDDTAYVFSQYIRYYHIRHDIGTRA